MNRTFNLEDYKNIMIKKYDLNLLDASLVLSFNSKIEIDDFIEGKRWT
jgi:hypothetical protein